MTDSGPVQDEQANVVLRNVAEIAQRQQQRELGASLALQIFRLLKVVQFHAIDNMAVLQQLDQTVESLRTFGAATGEPLVMLFAKGTIFVAGQLFKASRGEYENALELGEMVRKLGVSEITIQTDSTRADLTALAKTFAPGAKPLIDKEGVIEPSPRVRLRYVNPARLGEGEEELSPEEQIVRTYATSIVVMRRVHENLVAGRYELPHQAKRLAQRLVMLSEGDTPAFLGITAMRNLNHDLAGRAVNRAILAVAMARQLTDDLGALSRIAMSALFLDVAQPLVTGVVGRQDDVVVPYMTEDAEQRLPAATGLVLTALGQLRQASMVRTVIAYETQWLKQLDGLGPLYGGVRKAMVAARIVLTAHRFNAALEPDLAASRTPTVDEVVEKMRDEARDATERAMLALLVGALGIFPRGTPVELTTGERGVVVRTPGDPSLYMRPTVRLVYDAHGQPLQAHVSIDLAQDEERQVGSVIAQPDALLTEASRRVLEQTRTSVAPAPLVDAPPPSSHPNYVPTVPPAEPDDAGEPVYDESAELYGEPSEGQDDSGEAQGGQSHDDSVEAYEEQQEPAEAISLDDAEPLEELGGQEIAERISLTGAEVLEDLSGQEPAEPISLEDAEPVEEIESEAAAPIAPPYAAPIAPPVSEPIAPPYAAPIAPPVSEPIAPPVHTGPAPAPRRSGTAPVARPVAPPRAGAPRRDSSPSLPSQSVEVSSVSAPSQISSLTSPSHPSRAPPTVGPPRRESTAGMPASPGTPAPSSLRSSKAPPALGPPRRVESQPRSGPAERRLPAGVAAKAAPGAEVERPDPQEISELEPSAPSSHWRRPPATLPSNDGKKRGAPAVEQMHAPSASGSFERTPFSHILLYLLDRSLSGTLIFTEPADRSEDFPVEHAAYFEGGIPTKLNTGTRIAPLGSMLVAYGYVEQSQLESEPISQPPTHEATLEGELIDFRLVSREQVAEVRNEQLMERLTHMFGLPAGTKYAFYNGLDLLEAIWGNVPGTVSPLAALTRGMREHPEEAAMDRVLTRLAGAGLEIHPDSDLSAFDFDGSEQPVVDEIVATRASLPDLIEKGYDPDVIRRVVYVLLTTRCLAPVAAEEVPPAPAPKPGRPGKPAVPSRVRKG